MSNLAWHDNWERTKQRYIDWWNQDALILGMWGHGFEEPDRAPHEEVPEPPPPKDFEQLHSDPEYAAAYQHYHASRRVCPGEIVPSIRPNPGVVELSAYLGANLEFQEHTVWYRPTLDDTEKWPQPSFDPENKWFKKMLEMMEILAPMAAGKYAVGFSGISPNLDVLAELRGTGEIMMDLIRNPNWIHEKLLEIEEVYYKVYDRMYDIIKLPDGSSYYAPFMVWGPGKTAQLQCDAMLMVSPDMFDEFIAPGLKRVSEWLDNTIYHVDGPDALMHLDKVLAIDSIAAIEFTPGAGQPQGGDQNWWNYYHQILDAGKSLQAVWLQPDEVIPMIKEFGPNGLYLMVDCKNAAEMEKLAEEVEPYR